MQPAQDAYAGLVLKKTYRLEKLIGRGGMGSVYEAAHQRLPRRFAVKILHQPPDADPTLKERFLREAEICSRIDHENVVDIVDFDQTEGGDLYMVMEKLEGEDLAGNLRRSGPKDEAGILWLFRALCGALGAAHELDVVHRDLKPANIFLHRRRGEPVVKVLDFGIAKLRTETSVLTASGALVGTPSYMAPEQIESNNVDLRADIFALGAILYETVTGEVAFSGTSLAQVVHKIIYGERPNLDPDLPLAGPLQPVLDRCLSVDPDGRFSDVDSLWTALKGALEPLFESRAEPSWTSSGRKSWGDDPDGAGGADEAGGAGETGAGRSEAPAEQPVTGPVSAGQRKPGKDAPLPSQSTQPGGEDPSHASHALAATEVAGNSGSLSASAAAADTVAMSPTRAAPPTEPLKAGMEAAEGATDVEARIDESEGEGEKKDRPAGFWQRFFGVVVSKRAYMSLLYLLAAFPLGLAYFIVLAVGLSLGFGLTVTWVGIPILLLTLIAACSISQFEVGLLRRMVGVDIDRSPTVHEIGEEGVWPRVKAFLGNPLTWKSLVYLALKFPLSLLTFIITMAVTSAALGLLGAPLAGGVQVPGLSEQQLQSGGGWLGALLIGAVAFPLALHLAILQVRWHAGLARAMLSSGERNGS